MQKFPAGFSGGRIGFKSQNWEREGEGGNLTLHKNYSFVLRETHTISFRFLRNYVIRVDRWFLINYGTITGGR